MDYQEIIKGKDYDFLRTDGLKDHIMLLTVGGSHAYGTNTENSDIDIRGIALNSKREILLGQDFSSVTDSKTDTLILSFLHAIEMLRQANPTVLEMLYVKPEHRLSPSFEGDLLLKNRDIFLSKCVAYTFGGYSGAQLKGLEKAPKEKRGKKAMHVVRLLYNGIHILEEGTFSTYSREHELLMELRNGKYMEDDGNMKKEFYEMVEDLERKLERAKEKSRLPDKPDIVKVNNLTECINEFVVLGRKNERFREI